MLYIYVVQFVSRCKLIRMTRTYQEVYVRAFFFSSVVGGWELPLFMVQILMRKRQCGAQTRAKSFGAVQFWPFTVQINVHLVLRILHRCKFRPVAASVLNATFEA